MKNFLISCVVFGIVFNHSHAASVDPKVIAGGLAWNPNINRTVLPASPEPKKLPKEESLTQAQRAITDKARRLSEISGNLGILLIQNGRIVFENHNYPSSENVQLKSWSMSKSLTAMLIGIKHCQGDIPDLDRSAESYAPNLKGTAFGKASVRDLLKMSSGAQKTTTRSGEYRMSAWREIAVTKTMTVDQYLHEFGIPQKTFFGQKKSGETYDYNNIDTIALERIITSTSRIGFIEEFNKEIWKKASPENFGVWLRDRDGNAISYAGFNATLRDWARLAILSQEFLKGNDSCMRNFMKSMTTRQINTDRTSFTHYGYQTWVASWNGRSSYWWRGHAGQRIAVDPDQNLIMVVSSWNDDYQSQIYEFFRNWQLNN